VHATSLKALYARARGNSVIVIIPERISPLLVTMEMVTVIEVIYCANVLRKEKVQCARLLVARSIIEFFGLRS